MNTMNKLKYVMLLPLVCASIAGMSQGSGTNERKQKERADSLIRVEQRSERLSDLKSEQKQTKIKAEEAQRVERNASDAARESKDAYRAEQKAQKSRNKADKQAKKAAKARAKADN